MTLTAVAEETVTGPVTHLSDTTLSGYVRTDGRFALTANPSVRAASEALPTRLMRWLKNYGFRTARFRL